MKLRIVTVYQYNEDHHHKHNRHNISSLMFLDNLEQRRKNFIAFRFSEVYRMEKGLLPGLCWLQLL